jgi:hypothetical protein
MKPGAVARTPIYDRPVITITPEDTLCAPNVKAYALRVCADVGLDPNVVNQIDLEDESTVITWAFVMEKRCAWERKWPVTFTYNGGRCGGGILRIKRRHHLGDCPS